MPEGLLSIPTWAADGVLHAVIEAPRGSGVKIAYSPKLGAFTYGRTLPLGLTYPHCWGFIPGTRNDDGDPLDVLVLTDVPSYPGVVIAARPVGLVQVEQSDGRKRQRNDRIVAVPVTSPRNAEDVREPRDLPLRVRRELEAFFLNTTLFTQKNPKLLGWKGSKVAVRFVEEHQLGG